MDTSNNGTLLSLYTYDNLHNNASITSIVYVSNIIPFGFAINSGFDEFLDSFCEVCPTGVV